MKKTLPIILVLGLFLALSSCELAYSNSAAVNTAVAQTLESQAPYTTYTPNPEFAHTTPQYTAPIISVIDTPTQPKPDHVVGIYETDTVEKIIDVSKIEARNCGSNKNPITFSESFSSSITQAITFDISLTVSAEFQAKFKIPVTVSLEGKYSITEGKTITKTQDVSIPVSPNTYLEYSLVWKEVDVEGNAVIERTNGTQYTVPYKVVQSLRNELLDPINIGCN